MERNVLHRDKCNQLFNIVSFIRNISEAKTRKVYYTFVCMLESYIFVKLAFVLFGIF